MFCVTDVNWSVKPEEITLNIIIHLIYNVEYISKTTEEETHEFTSSKTALVLHSGKL